MADSPHGLGFLADDFAATERWLAALPGDAQLMLCHDVFLPDAGARDAFKQDAERRPGAFKSYEDSFDDPAFPFWLTYMEPVASSRAAVEALASSMVRLAEAHRGDYNGFKLLWQNAQGADRDRDLFDPTATPG